MVIFYLACLFLRLGCKIMERLTEHGGAPPLYLDSSQQPPLPWLHASHGLSLSKGGLGNICICMQEYFDERLASVGPVISN